MTETLQPSPPQSVEEEKRQDLAKTAEELTPAQKQARAQDAAPSTGLSDAVKQQSHLPTDIGTTNKDDVAAAIASASQKPVAQPPTPTPTKKDDDSKSVPGSFANVGWTAFSKLPNPGDEEALEVLAKNHTPEQLSDLYKGTRPDTTQDSLSNDVLATYLKENYYGEWYHNTAAMFFAVFFTWLLTRLGGGLFVCFIVGAFLGTCFMSGPRSRLCLF